MCIIAVTPTVKFVDISNFVKSGQLFIKICIYALHTVAVINISINIPSVFAGHTVYSHGAINTSKIQQRTYVLTRPNHHKVYQTAVSNNFLKFSLVTLPLGASALVLSPYFPFQIGVIIIIEILLFSPRLSKLSFKKRKLGGIESIFFPGKWNSPFPINFYSKSTM